MGPTIVQKVYIARNCMSAQVKKQVLKRKCHEGNITGVILKGVKSCDSKREDHSGQWMQKN